MSETYLAAGGPTQNQLWVVTLASDGTASASELVDLYPGGPGRTFAAYGSSSQSPYFTPFGNGFLFAAYGVANEYPKYTPGSPGYGDINAQGSKTGRELWYTNGQAGGTHLVYDIYQGTHAYNPELYVGNSGIPAGSTDIFVLNGGVALFTGVDKTNGNEALFATSGTSSASQISPPSLYNPQDLTLLNGKALFIGSISVGGAPVSYLYETDGTLNGTVAITGPGGPLGGVTLFATQLQAGGESHALFIDGSQNLWTTDGTTTSELTTAGDASNRALAGLSPSEAVFFVNDPSGALDLWITNGTAAGTTLVQANVSAVSATYVSEIGVFTNPFGATEAFFETSNNSDTTQPVQLWVSDGTTGGTTLIDGDVGATGVDAAGDRLVFLTGDASGDIGIAATDGRAADTVQLKSSDVSFFHAGPTGQIVFVEGTGAGGTLYSTDGTAAGTRAVASGDSHFGSYLAADGKFFFTANASGVNSLFVLGATGGATELTIGADYGPSNLTVSGNEVFFDAYSPGGRTDTWVTDGTQAGTLLIANGPIALGNKGDLGAPPCFLAGTPILTARGEIPVEELRVGDLAMTLSGKGALLKPIIWIGRSRFDASRHPRPNQVRPVRIAAGALGDAVPHRDLLVSPGHSLFLDGALIQAERLINGATIVRDGAVGPGEYFHVELAEHDILVSAGAASESYLDTGNRGAFGNAADIVELHADFSPRHWTDTCAELIEQGPILVDIRRRLLRRALQSGFRVTDDNGLHVIADGQRVAATPIGERVYHFAPPPGSRDIRLASRIWVPGELEPESSDARRLGVFVRRIEIAGRALPLGDAALTDGWHRLEHDAGGDGRWTAGLAQLPEGAADITVALGGVSTYWAHEPFEPTVAASRPRAKAKRRGKA